MTVGRRLADHSYDLVTRRGRRSPALAWRVREAAGETRYLSGLQHAQLLWETAQTSRGRHRWTLREEAAALACGPGVVSKNRKRLRSLSLIGGPAPARGRHGGALTWIPTARSQWRDAAIRRAVWPTSGNDSTLTTFGGYLSRAGAARSWARRGGRPPGARPPGGGPALARSPRARGRPWPPAYVDELCPSTRRVGRLRRQGLVQRDADVGVIYGGRCPRCRRAHVVSMTFLRPDPDPARRPGDRYPTADQAAIAADWIRNGPPLEHELVEVLRERYLGWIRPPVWTPPLPPLVDGPLEELADLVAAASSLVAGQLADVAATRQLIEPAGRT